MGEICSPTPAKSAGVANGRRSEANEVAIVLSDCLRLYEIRLASRASRRRPSDGGGGAVCDWKIGDEGARKVFRGGVTVVPGGGGPERRTVPSGRLQAPGRLTIGPQVANLPHKQAGGSGDPLAGVGARPTAREETDG